MFEQHAGEPAGKLSASEAAGAAIRLAASNYRLLLGSVSAVLIPTAIIGGATLGVWRSAASTGNGGSSLRNPASGIGFVVLVLGNLFAQAVGVYAAVSSAVGGQETWRHSLAIAAGRWRQCLLAGLLVVILSSLALLAFVIPGIMLFFGWFVAMPVVVLEGRSARSALARSWSLTRGRRLSLLGSYILVELVIIACSLPLGVIAGAIFAGSSTRVVVAQQVVTYLIEVLLTPLQVALVAVVYLDLRLRHEHVSARQIALEAHIDLANESSPEMGSTRTEGIRSPMPTEWPPLPFHEQDASGAPQDDPLTPPPPPRTDVRSGTSWQVSPKPSDPRRIRLPAKPPTDEADLTEQADRAVDPPENANGQDGN